MVSVFKILLVKVIHIRVFLVCFLIGYSVDTVSLPNAVEISRNYLFELDPKLKDVASMIDSLSNEDINTFVDIVISLSNGVFYDLKQIENIEKYAKVEI